MGRIKVWTSISKNELNCHTKEVNCIIKWNKKLDMIHPPKRIMFNTLLIKRIKLYGLDQKSWIKTNNYSAFYLLKSNTEKSYKMDKNDHLSTLKSHTICYQNESVGLMWIQCGIQILERMSIFWNFFLPIAYFPKLKLLVLLKSWTG